MRKTGLILVVVVLSRLTGLAVDPPQRYAISVLGNQVVIQAGILERTFSIDGSGLRSSKLLVNGNNLLADNSNEISVRLQFASPNARPVGIRDSFKGEITQVATNANLANEKAATDGLVVQGADGFVKQVVQWVSPQSIQASSWDANFDYTGYSISYPKKGVSRLSVRTRNLKAAKLFGLLITQHYEIHEGHPVIRKWVEFTNTSDQWLKVDSLLIDNSRFVSSYRSLIDLTPSEFGAATSIRSFSNVQQNAGIIVGSEVPSALRLLDSTGTTGYAPDHFEWVIGPQESFVSESVFHYAYSGEVVKTASGLSTPLDRTVERSFKNFLIEIVGILPPTVSHVPMWCSWSNFSGKIADTSMRRMAIIAGKIGFKGMLLDAGWGPSDSDKDWMTSNIFPDSTKFPDFRATAGAIKAENLILGLWVTVYRNPEITRDFKAVPTGYSLPRVWRQKGLAMSFASEWRDYYANDLVGLRDQYGATYFKQDLTNIKFGDIAYNHESRTHKESLLRGLRGLFMALDKVRRDAPDVVQEITHELYWGTPGTPCDIAALKHSSAFHIPPNDYHGCGPHPKRYSPSWTNDPDSLRTQLLKGCFNARSRFYAYRGLPLYGIEYYAAATVNHRGSLTSEVQRRQVCSWLMGVPNVFAGDLASLTDENINVYRASFDILSELQDKYAIYEHFQFSGVPAPTDTDWHWWGKLNHEGSGAVVVLRGSKGREQREINIPWVLPTKEYTLRLRFSGRNMGKFSGKALIDGQLSIKLPVNGQEIIELTML